MIKIQNKNYWINSNWSKFKGKKLDQLDLSQIQWTKYKINTTWSKSRVKIFDQHHLIQIKGTKYWINLSWSSVKKNIEWNLHNPTIQKSIDIWISQTLGILIFIGLNNITKSDVFDPNPMINDLLRRSLPRRSTESPGILRSSPEKSYPKATGPLQIREKKVQSDQNYRTGPAKNNQKNVLSGTGEIMSLIINYWKSK